MKIFILSLAFILFFSTIAYSHPPEYIEVKIIRGLLVIKVEHSAGNSLRHYIDRIKVVINQKKTYEKEFTSQLGFIQESYFLIRDLQEEDRVQITAYCNMYGELTKEIIVFFDKEKN